MRQLLKSGILGVLAGLFLCLVSPTYAVSDQKPSFKRDYLLILNSYTSDAPWSGTIIGQVRNWYAADKRTAVFVEDLNMLMINDSIKLRDRKDNVLKKYVDQPPKAILLLGNNALILRDEIQSLWGDISMVLCPEEDYMGPDEFYVEKKYIPENERIPLKIFPRKYNLTVIQSKVFLEENIELLLDMIPHLEKVMLIGDGRYINQQFDYDLKNLVERKYAGLELEYEFLSAEDITLDELVHRLEQIDVNTTGVLFSSWFSKLNYSGNTVLTTNSFRTLANLPVPVFALKRAVMDNSGIIGGCLYDETEFMHQLQRMLEEVISGTPARTIPFYIPSGAIPTFDYPSLSRKGFTEDDCPPASLFLNHPQTYWERNKYPLIFVGSFIVLLLLFLFIYQRYRIRSLETLNAVRKQQIETSQEMAKLFDDMPIAYLKAKLLCGDDGEISDAEITRMNGLFIRNFIREGDRLDGWKASELFGADFRATLRFLLLMDSQHQKMITYTQYFSMVGKYMDVVVTHATQPGYIDIYYIDATDLHKAQMKLDETNRKLAMSLDVANIVPWNWNLSDHQILCDVNRSVELGIPDPIVARNKLSVSETQYFSKIYKEDRHRVETAYKKLIAGEVDKIQEEYRVISHASTGFHLDWVEVQAAVENRDENGVPITLVGSSLVITERKKMEQDLIDARDKAEESNRLKSAFLANMSYEIRTPLNAIVGFSGLLNSVEEPEEREEYVRIIENNNDLLLQLVSDILDLSKIEAGTLEFVSTSFDVTVLMEDIVRSLQVRAQKKNLTLEFKKDLPACNILMDRNRLNQVLTNLVTNAIKFTDEGGITIGYRFEKDMLRFYVSDTGCGIPSEKQKDIFVRFVKLNNFVQGTGLGLSICQTIVKKLGGEIGVESDPGKGSTFWFTTIYQPDKQIPTSLPERKLVPVASNEITILIAEDNISNFKLFETILKKDYRILHAWNGQEAVDMFKAYSPHIILMDINMPVMDGYQATAEIRKISKGVPILAVTAYAYSSDEKRILNYGFDGYTPKPIKANILRSQIVEMINSRLLLLF